MAIQLMSKLQNREQFYICANANFLAKVIPNISGTPKSPAFLKYKCRKQLQKETVVQAQFLINFGSKKGKARVLLYALAENIYKMSHASDFQFGSMLVTRELDCLHICALAIFCATLGTIIIRLSPVFVSKSHSLHFDHSNL